MGVQTFEWDESKGKYVPEGTLPEIKIDFLSEIGTRYTHWVELLEEFRSGIVAIDIIREQYKGKAEEVKRTQLVGAVELIEKQLERHSGYDRKIWAVGTQVNAIPKKAEDVRDK